MQVKLSHVSDIIQHIHKCIRIASSLAIYHSISQTALPYKFLQNWTSFMKHYKSHSVYIPQVVLTELNMQSLILFHSEWPKLYGVLAVLSATGLNLFILSSLQMGKLSFTETEIPYMMGSSVTSSHIILLFSFFLGELLLCCCFTSTVNIYGQVGMVS